MTQSAAVQSDAVVACSHGTGKASPQRVSDRITLGGQPTVPVDALWAVQACTNTNPGPCTTAVWTTGSVRVTSHGIPLVVQGGTSLCAPPVAVLQVREVQYRVRVS